ncbi:ATP-binding protein [Streptomyces lycii]|uniref:ATP-binding protein n=1 Tax=Streptomyces lycii TaxID=2654337 RepID=A0ABQ7FIR0_9ACTN|nr:ATP-binding protein [Streptomyces lycii]KAF4408856.1 ATP-binding protein [Streptomyces lycii]
MADESSQRYEQRLRVDPRILAGVRRTVAARLREWGRGELVGPAAMCVTELFSNVYKHTATADCLLTLQNLPHGVRAAVTDPEPVLPVAKEPDHLSETGRGLFLLGETADRWGALPVAEGKEVWFELDAGPAAGEM